jgi:hypothetical protein
VTAKGGTGGGGVNTNTLGSMGSTPTGSGGVLLPPTENPRGSISIGIFAFGGSTWFGRSICNGPVNASAIAGFTGSDANGYGAGGCGAGKGGGGTGRAGGDGAPGVILVLEYA